MGQQTINATDPSAEIKTEGGRFKKDVKQVRLAVEGADVQLIKVVLGWDNRSDDTIVARNRKSGGNDGSERCARTQRAAGMGEAAIQILGKAKNATVKVMGLD